MKSLFYRIEEKLISPIKKYLAEFIILLLLLLWLPSAFIEAENTWHLLKKMVAGVILMHNIQFLFNVALAYAVFKRESIVTGNFILFRIRTIGGNSIVGTPRPANRWNFRTYKFSKSTFGGIITTRRETNHAHRHEQNHTQNT